MNRWILFALFALAAAPALADRHLHVPTGSKVRSNTFRLEAWAQAGERARYWLDAGLGPKFDGALTWSSNSRLSFDASYNWLTPVVDLVPGISFGVQDALGSTPEGRALYAAVTYRIGNLGQHNQDVPTEAHLGFWTRPGGLMFFGVSLPFSKEFRLLAEHDADVVTAGFEVRPIKDAALRFLWRDGAPGLSLRFSQRF